MATDSMDVRVDHLEQRLKAKVESDSGFADDATQCVKLQRVFQHFNADKDGWISFSEFNAALVRLNFVGVQAEVRALFDRYDVDASGLLSYEEFSAGLFGLVPNVHSSPETRSAVERVRQKIAERGGLNGIRTLGRIMRTMDDSGDRRLDREELKWGLKDYGVDMSDRDLDTVLGAFDRNGDGLINFDEFLRGIRGRLNARRRTLILLAYDVLDKDGSGVVDIKDIQAAYDVSEHPEVKAGKKTPDEALEDFMAQWEGTKKDGVVTKEEFLDYYKDVSASVDDDDMFELIIRNAWHISGGEGWCENTANRRVLVTYDSGETEVVEIKDDLGLEADDIDGMMARLEAQGVKGIAKIDTHF
jgi:Ca2+-binding EF-hand superfamily protein